MELLNLLLMGHEVANEPIDSFLSWIGREEGELIRIQDQGL